MLSQIHHKLQERRVALFAFALTVILLLYMYEPVNVYLMQSLYSVYGMGLIIVMTAFYLYFRGLQDGWEVRMAIGFVVWFAITRILNGDVALLQEDYLVVSSMLIICYTALGGLLSREGRGRVLRVVSLGALLFYTVLGFFDLYSYLTRQTLYYARTQVTIGIAYTFRMELMGYNPNASALWYLLSSALLVYLFLSCKRKFWRVPIACALLVHYLVLASLYSRNTQVAYSGCAGLLAVLVLREHWHGGRKAGRAAVQLVVFVLSAALCLGSFVPATLLMGAVSKAVAGVAEESEPVAEESLPTETVDEAAESPAAEETLPTEPAEAAESPAPVELAPEDIPFRDTRRFTDDSDRFVIYRTLPTVFREEPLRLLRGCLFSDRMTISNRLMPEAKPHMHNSWIEILNLTGIPGLLFLLGYCVLLLYACGRVFFSADPAQTLAIKCLTLPVLGCFSYSLLESLLFFRTDVRTLCFYLLAGMVIAESKTAKAWEL